LCCNQCHGRGRHQNANRIALLSDIPVGVAVEARRRAVSGPTGVGNAAV
jgi:hypothetical protein